MSKYLLKEYYSLCPSGICNLEFLTEDEKRMKSNGDFLLTGILQMASVRNGNGRIYPKNILSREMQNYQKVIKENRAVGCLDHEDSSVIGLQTASHLIIRAWMDGDVVYGVLKVLSTPSGQTLKALVKDGVSVGISSRALGSLSESPQGSVVNDDLQLITFDIVAEPSSPGAYLTLKESKECDIKGIITKADRINRTLNLILGK